MLFQNFCQNGRPERREDPQSTSLHETSRMKSVWGRTQWFFVENNWWHACENLEKRYEKAWSSPPEFKQNCTQSWRRSRELLVPFFEFWRGGTRSRIFFLEVFAKNSLILSDDNTKEHKRWLFVSNSGTDFIRLVSSKLMLRGLPVVRDGRLYRFFEKHPTKKK